MLLMSIACNLDLKCIYCLYGGGVYDAFVSEHGYVIVYLNPNKFM